jgi:hypothetical protein
LNIRPFFNVLGEYYEHAHAHIQDRQTVRRLRKCIRCRIPGSSVVVPWVSFSIRSDIYGAYYIDCILNDVEMKKSEENCYCLMSELYFEIKLRVNNDIMA